MDKKIIFISLLLLFLSYFLKSQTCIIEIKVIDTVDKLPLDFVSVSFKLPDKKNWDMEFTDKDGWFRTSQHHGLGIKYNFTYLGYHEQSLTVFCDINIKQKYTVEMKKSAVRLDEVIITDKFPSIVEKQDTVIYSVVEFTSGKEEKLKEVLNKLPGIHVDRNNEVTFNGEKVTELLIENEKFFTGDPSLAVKYIPANAVERVEVLEKYNQVKALRSTTINDKLTLNIKLKPDKKKLVFGESEAGTNLKDRHILHNNTFYFSSTFTANNILDYKTTQDEVLSQGELFRIIGPEMDNYDPKLRTGSFDQIFKINNMLSSANVFDQRSLFGIQQLRVKTKNKISIEGIFLGFDRHDKSASDRIVTYPDNKSGDQYSTINKNNESQYKYADVSLNTNPENNYFISYHFRYTNNDTHGNDTSNNRFSVFTNTLFNDQIFTKSNYEHRAKYIQQWHKKLQSILIFNRSDFRQSYDHIWNAKGMFIPELYQQNAENVSIKNNGVQPGNHTYMLLRVNYNINYTNKIQLFARYENTAQNNNINVQGKKNIPGEDHQFLVINHLTGNPLFSFYNVVAGTRYIYADQINEVNLGIDYVALSFGLKNNNSWQHINRIAPYFDVSRNINKIGRLGISYLFDFRLPTLAHLNPFYTINQFTVFSLGDIGLFPEQKHSLSFSLKRSKTIKGLAQNINLTYSITDMPIISAFEIKNQSFVETFYNSTKQKNDISLHYIYSKIANKLKIFNHLLGVYSNYHQRIQEIETPFSQYSFIHRLTLSRQMEKVEIAFNLSNSVRNIPLINQTSSWIYQPEVNLELKYFLGKNWSLTFDATYNTLLSKSLNQTSFPVTSKIQFKTDNEKYKINLNCNNLFGQKFQASNRIDIFSSSVTNQRLFPMQIYLSFIYIY